MARADEHLERDDAPRGEVTRLLRSAQAGHMSSATDADRLLELTYSELRGLAARFLASERTDHTLQPTALVHEAWMRLADQQRVDWRGKAHFLGVAAQAMRRILVDHARAKRADRRGGGRERIDLGPGSSIVADERSFDLVAIDEALERLKALAPAQARIVELRFFGGLDMAEVARVAGTSLRSAEREWRFARVWLEHELRSSS